MRKMYLTLTLIMGLTLSATSANAAKTVIKSGSQVAFDFSLTVDGKIVETSKGKKPLEYTQGDGKLLPGLAKNLEGMSVGQEKTITLPPAQAFGEPNPKGIQEVPMSQLPPDIKPVVGMILQTKDDTGRVFPLRVIEIKKDKVIVDFNPPLAGKTLTFKVKIVSIK